MSKDKIIFKQFLGLAPGERPSVMDAEGLWNIMQERTKERDEAREELKQVKAVAYNYADFTPTCEKDGACFVCNEYLHGDKHANDCLATLFRRVIKDGEKASVVWLEVLDAKEEAEETINEMRREGCAAVGLVENIFNGLTAIGIPDDLILKQMADACAKLLFEVTRCEHKIELERIKNT